MNFTENVKEGFKAIKDNLLRTSLTVAIIAIGLTSLVGILTAIDSIQYNITSGLADLGANSFDIKDKSSGRRGRHRGMAERPQKPLRYEEVLTYKNTFDADVAVSLRTTVTGNAEVKYQSQTTNPNTLILGIDENYLNAEGLNLAKGRSFSTLELRSGANVVILGDEVTEKLFGDTNPVDEFITMMGERYKVVGVLEKKASMGGGGGAARTVLVPIQHAVLIGAGHDLPFSVTTSVKDPAQLDFIMGEATGKMRQIRRDQPGRPESFEISRSESLALALEQTTGQLRIGGGIIAFITLLGAAIGLMNIMMVSVTERTREIGIRKALGASPMRIRQQFLIEAIVICQIGGIIGIALGIMIGNVIAAMISAGSFIIPWFWIILGLLVCIIVGILSGFYPAYKASRLDPIESLRFE